MYLTGLVPLSDLHASPLSTPSNNSHHRTRMSMPLPPLLHPILHTLPHPLQLLLRHRQPHLRMRLPRLHKMPHPLVNPQMIIPNHRHPLLIAPNQIPHVLRRPRYHVMCRRHTRENRSDESNQDIAVPTDDRAGHGGDEDVDAARQELLVGFFWWCE